MEAVTNQMAHKKKLFSIRSYYKNYILSKKICYSGIVGHNLCETILT